MAENTNSPIWDFIASKPKTYIPLILLVITLLTDNILPLIGLQVKIPEETKASIAGILFAIALFFLRRGSIKEADLSKFKVQLVQEITDAIANRKAIVTEKPKEVKPQ